MKKTLLSILLLSSSLMIASSDKNNDTIISTNIKPAPYWNATKVEFVIRRTPNGESPKCYINANYKYTFDKNSQNWQSQMKADRVKINLIREQAFEYFNQEIDDAKAEGCHDVEFYVNNR